MPTDFVLRSLVFHRIEGTARCDESTSIRPLIDIFRLGFVQACWIAQWEYNRSFHVLRHFPDDIFRECSRFGRCADQYMRLCVLDDGEEVTVLVLWPLGVFSCEGRLGWC